MFESNSSAYVAELQDFYGNDTKLAFTCYRPQGLSVVISLDLNTGQTTDHSQSQTIYNEVEGIFPDGRFSAFQAARTADEAGVGYGLLLMTLPR